MPNIDPPVGFRTDWQWNVDGVSGDTPCEIWMTHDTRDPYTIGIALFKKNDPNGTPSLMVRLGREQLRDLIHGAERGELTVLLYESEHPRGMHE